MSKSHGILLPRLLSEQELRDFVEGEGGHWQSDRDLPQGFIGDNEVWLFIRGIDDQQESLRQYTRRELAEAAHALGVPVVAALSVDHTKADKGDELAKRVIGRMLARWNAYHIDGG